MIELNYKISKNSIHDKSHLGRGGLIIKTDYINRRNYSKINVHVNIMSI